MRWSPSGWNQLECPELYLTQSSSTIRFLCLLLVAITQIGLDTHTMRSEVAVSLIGAGMLSVLIYPLLALLVHRRGERVEPPG